MNIVHRPAGTPPVAPPLAEAVPDELCDRCCAAARHRVPVMYFPGPLCLPRLGHLFFCTHHYRSHEVALLADSAVWF